MFVLSTAQADDCITNISCGKCDKQSEFAWNPENAYLTNQLRYFYQLPQLIDSHYQNGNFNTAAKYAKEYLNLATAYRCNWNYGNAIHEANRYLGLISLINKDNDKAAMYLLRAAQTPGSMQLKAFGPELDLANHLLKKGKRDAVVKYLAKIDNIWDSEQQIAKWISKIHAGKKPLLQRPSEVELQQRFTANHIF